MVEMVCKNVQRVAYVVYLVGFLDLLGVSMVVPLLSKHARHLGASPSLAGLIGSVYGGLQLFSSPLIGRWSDVSGRRHVLLWTLLLSVVGYSLLGVSTSLLVLCIARIPPGIFKHTQELGRGYLSDVYPRDEHSRLFGNYNAMGMVAFIIGPALGGHLADLPGGFHLAAGGTVVVFMLNTGIFKHTASICKLYIRDVISSRQERMHQMGLLYASGNFGFTLGPVISGHMVESYLSFHTVALLTSAIFVLNAVLVWWVLPEVTDLQKPVLKEQSKDSKKNSFQFFEFFDAFKKIEWTNIWDLFLVRFILSFAVLVYRGSFNLMLDYKYEASAKVAGYLTSYSALIGTLSGFLVGRIASFYNNDERLFLHTAILQLLSIVAITFSPSIWLMALAMTPLSLANQVARVCSINLTMEKGHGQEKGALLGLGASVLSIARMLAPTFGGIAQEFHVSGPCFLGAVFAGIGVLTLLFGPNFRQQAPPIKEKES